MGNWSAQVVSRKMRYSVFRKEKRKSFFMDEKNYAEIFNHISLLYELSLSVGNSLDITENCDVFLKKLMSRKKVNLVSVWIKDEYLDFKKAKKATLIYSNPEYYIKLRNVPVSHFIYLPLTIF